MTYLEQFPEAWKVDPRIEEAQTLHLRQSWCWDYMVGIKSNRVLIHFPNPKGNEEHILNSQGLNPRRVDFCEWETRHISKNHILTQKSYIILRKSYNNMLFEKKVHLKYGGTTWDIA